MIFVRPARDLATHSVTNQPRPYEDVDRYEDDVALSDAVTRGGAGWAESELREVGVRVGSAEVQDLARQAQRHPPRLMAFDRYGQRVDEVEFHPAYHRLMALGIEAGVGSVAWAAEAGGYTAHSALLYLLTGADPGVCCPFSMTHASVPALRHQPNVAAEWEPRVLARAYDPASRPANEKAGATIGMAMTEKQGGSDVRANTTRATPTVDGYTLVGHKWFCSAPMSDAFLTLANTDAGLSCFLVPRWKPDGTRNAIQLMRLKDKLGDRANASAEIEYHGAWATRVGVEGQGVRTIVEMVNGTRVDCMFGSAGLMRAALVNAIWHCSQRRAFGRTLLAQPAMARVLADLALEQEAALALAFRVARAYDLAPDSAHDAAIARLLTPVAKYWICKRTPGFVYEAMECHGGNGYVEDSPLPALFRQSPLNSIWEGSGNVVALDAVRALARDPGVLDAVFAEIAEAKGLGPAFARRVATLESMAAAGIAEEDARRFAENLALVFQAATLAAAAPVPVAEAFVSARLAEPSASYGAFSGTLDSSALIARALPRQP